MKRNSILVYVTLALLAVAGCTNWERQTYQTLAASQATINQAQADYEGGTAIPHNQAAYTTINTAKTAQTAAVNQMVAYEQLKATGAPASALTAAEAQVETALTQLPAIIAEIKALYTTTPTVAVKKVN